MKLKPKNFLLAMLCTLIVFTASYLYAFWYQLGSPVKAEWWVQHFYYYKDHLASSTDGRKIIIIAGSNALFGIDSNVIREKTGIKTINMAVHVGVGLEYYYFNLKKHMKDGDVVVMPLEFAIFLRTPPSDWFINNMLAWGWEDFLSRLSLYELATFISYVPPKRLFEGVIKQGHSNPLLSREKIIEEVENSILNGQQGLLDYDHRSLNEHGDLLIDSPPLAKLQKKYKDGTDLSVLGYLSLSEYFLKKYKKISDLVDKRKGKLIVTWQALVRNKKYDLTTVSDQKLMERYTQLMALNGVDVQCNPALFNLDLSYYYDTGSHLNRYGAVIRSENLGACLDKILRGNYKKLSYKTANDIVRLQEASYSEAVQFNDTFYRRINDLKAIVQALDAYYSETGAYPVSKGWDGLYASWGGSGVQWIPGLVPEYINKLPRDPRKNSNPAMQYLYNSNGVDYKIIAHSPEDYVHVARKHPELIDSSKKRKAYGFWTRNARKW